MQEPNYNITDGNGSVIGSIGTNSNGDVVVEHSSGETVVLDGNGLTTDTVSANSVSTDEATINDAGNATTNRLIKSIGGSNNDEGGEVLTQHTDGVSTTATVILTSQAGQRDTLLVVVAGKETNGAPAFHDIVIFGVTGGTSILHSEQDATPAARTYARSGQDLELSMSSGTYNVSATAVASYVDT